MYLNFLDVVRTALISVFTARIQCNPLETINTSLNYILEDSVRTAQYTLSVFVKGELMYSAKGCLLARSQNAQSIRFKPTRPPATRLLQNASWQNFLFRFTWKSVEKIQVSLKSDNTRYFTRKRYHIYDSVSINASYNGVFRIKL